ncbi:MAG TPA: hypothetical protein VGH90_01855 [Chthoniobacteraceae bacterium]
MRYFANLPASRFVLWCYLIWYLFFATRYFERDPTLWMTSVGISAIIGVALLLSTWHDHAKLVSWTTVRLFLMPFCVSSFSALVKGHGFILVFSPHKWENIMALAICAAFGLFVLSARFGKTKEMAKPDASLNES